MSEQTIVAVVILIGIFVVVIVTILKEGVDSLIKMWALMGTLAGLAIGSILSFYFTNASNQAELNQVKTEKKVVQTALTDVALKAEDAQNEVKKAVLKIPESENKEITRQLEGASKKLTEIKQIEEKVKIVNKTSKTESESDND